MSNGSNGGMVIKKENFISIKTVPISKDYTLGKIIGEGAFGSVRLGVHKPTKQVRAVKIWKKSAQDMKLIYDEIEILSKLSHPNIMQIYEVFNDNTNFYIVSEYCQGGELFDAISKKESGFGEKNASIIMKQILSAVCYSHKNNIVHRDLKPENILLDEKNSKDLAVKIIDWGCASKFTKNTKMTSTDGTAYYIAPEVWKNNYDEKCDVWSCGVILYILLCGYPPFDGDNDEEIYKRVINGKFEFRPEEWKHISKEAKDWIQKMLTIDPTKRYSAWECLADKWFKNNKTKSSTNLIVAKGALSNMKKFKKNKKLEQATISFIVNQLISKDEHKELLKQFKEWDTNGDGVLNREEIINGYRKTYGVVDENEIDNMIESIDLDGNGVIDYNEFLNCAINRDKILSKENIEFTFKAFDKDGSGNLSVDEWMEIFNKNGKDVDRSVFDKMWKSADENGDGEISLEEFKQIMMKFFV